MRIRPYSDLHLEFFASSDVARRFVDSLPNENVDVCILAGDIDSPWLARRSISRALSWFAARYKRVLYLPGNHEFYGGFVDATLASIHDACDDLGNVDLLEPGKIVTIDGQRFLGATLWFPRPEDDKGKWAMTDFERIGKFEPWVYRMAQESYRFLETKMMRGDVVVTHHLPSHELVHPKWKSSILNKYFVHACDEIIEQIKPVLWINGHTHSSHDRFVNAGCTRMVCNPYGYEGHELNREFDPALTIEIP